ncbi:hypothetical protein MD484_g444, partial [Candolleomyces efflorescens]
MDHAQNEGLSPEVVQAIYRILETPANTPESDPFDGLADGFSAVRILNEYFPNEASLERLDEVGAQLAATHRQLQEEVDSLQEELKRSQDPDRMSIIQEMISDLLGQMSRIREKATESEAVVRNITKDIQVLDLVKRNLIHSTTTLKRLQMLVNALTQLEDLMKEKKYSEVAQKLAAVKQISATFETYTGVPRIARLWKRIKDIQGQLRNQLEEDFDNFFIQDPNKQIKATLIGEACTVVDVLGVQMRHHIVDRFVALEMKEYRRIFRTNDEAGQLDNLSRRYAWFRRLISSFEIEQGRVFPAEWKVGWHLLAKFAEITRDHVTTLLTKIGPALTVKALLESIQITLEFEASIAKKWVTPFQDILKATDVAHSQPGQSITSIFEPHMNIFIDAQDKQVISLFAMTCIPDALTLDQCASLSTGQPLYDLANLHKKWLRIYAEEVLTLGAAKRPPSQIRKSVETRSDTELLKQTCLVINTADYCQTTALELEEKIKEKINPEFKEKISFQAERDMFVSTISAAIGVQLREFELTCDPAFITLARTSWATVSQVTGPSAYTGELVKAAEQVTELIKPLIEQKKYLRNFFDKACRYSRALTKTASRLEALLKVIVTPEDPAEGFILNYTLLIGDASSLSFQKILDLKGTPKSIQNTLHDSFLSITSTKTDLESASFLSSLDMDPPTTGAIGGSLLSPGGSRLSLPLNAAGSDSIFAGLSAPSPSGPPTGSSASGDARQNEPSKQVFSDFRRFVSFGLRKDSTPPS